MPPRRDCWAQKPSAAVCPLRPALRPTAPSSAIPGTRARLPSLAGSCPDTPTPPSGLPAPISFISKSPPPSPGVSPTHSKAWFLLTVCFPLPHSNFPALSHRSASLGVPPPGLLHSVRCALHFSRPSSAPTASAGSIFTHWLPSSPRKSSIHTRAQIPVSSRPSCLWETHG